MTTARKSALTTNANGREKVKGEGRGKGGKPVPRLVQPEGGPTRDAGTGISRERPPVVKSAFTFVNLRSQTWWEFAEGVKRGRWCILNPTKEMIRDLTAPRYQYLSALKIKVDSTDDIKELTGHSPDAGTAIVQAAFEWPKAPVVRSMSSPPMWTG